MGTSEFVASGQKCRSLRTAKVWRPLKKGQRAVLLGTMPLNSWSLKRTQGDKCQNCTAVHQLASEQL